MVLCTSYMCIIYVHHICTCIYDMYIHIIYVHHMVLMYMHIICIQSNSKFNQNCSTHSYFYNFWKYECAFAYSSYAPRSTSSQIHVGMLFGKWIVQVNVAGRVSQRQCEAVKGYFYPGCSILRMGINPSPIIEKSLGQMMRVYHT